MKMTYAEAMMRLADGHAVYTDEVYTKAQRRTVWYAEWHMPGCLSETFELCTNKADAIESALAYATTDDGSPRGMRTALRKRGGHWASVRGFGTVITTIGRTTLADCLAVRRKADVVRLIDCAGPDAGDLAMPTI